MGSLKRMPGRRLSRSSRRSDSRPRNLVRRTSREPRESNARSTWSFTRTSNVDSAVQVAHALSTHAVEIESDYFTAVDDYKLDEDDAGAGMIGTVEFTSETLYRFAAVAVSTLKDNLGDVDLTAQAASAFVRGFIMSMPTGKQNTFANNTIPDAVPRASSGPSRTP